MIDASCTLPVLMSTRFAGRSQRLGWFVLQLVVAVTPGRVQGNAVVQLSMAGLCPGVLVSAHACILRAVVTFLHYQHVL